MKETMRMTRKEEEPQPVDASNQMVMVLVADCQSCVDAYGRPAFRAPEDKVQPCR